MTSQETEARFNALSDEWFELVSSSERRQLASWNAAMAGMNAEDAALRAAGRWTHGRSDTLGLLGRARLELDHSAMLAWLLTPTGHHGLGTRFLERMLARCASNVSVASLDGRVWRVRSPETT